MTSTAVFPVLRWAKRFADRLFFATCRAVLRKPTEQGSNAVLIVRTDGIGDLAYFGRYLPSIRRRYPSARVVVCCRSESAELAGLMPEIDEVIPFEYMRCRRDFFYRFRIHLKVRSIGAVVALYTSFHREHVGDEITILSGARETIAMSGNDECIHRWMLRRNNVYYGMVVDVPDHVHEHFRYSRFFSAFGATAGGELTQGLRLNDPERAANLPPEVQKISEMGRFGVVAPGASGLHKRWPASSFSELVRAICAAYDIPLVLVGVPEESGLLSAIGPEDDSKIVRCTSLSIGALIVLLKKAMFFVGNDSGALHLASSVGTAAIGVIGGMHFSQYFPYGSVRVVNHAMDCYECNARCIYEEHYCLTRISVNEVLVAIDGVLRKQR